MSPFRSHVADLAILDAVFKCAVDPCLLGLFQMAFAVTKLHELWDTQSALLAPRATLQAAAFVQDSDTYNNSLAYLLTARPVWRQAALHILHT